MRKFGTFAPRRGVVDFSVPCMREYLRENDERLRALYEIDD